MHLLPWLVVVLANIPSSRTAHDVIDPHSELTVGPVTVVTFDQDLFQRLPLEFYRRVTIVSLLDAYETDKRSPAMLRLWNSLARSQDNLRCKPEVIIVDGDHCSVEGYFTSRCDSRSNRTEIVADAVGQIAETLDQTLNSMLEPEFKRRAAV